MRKTAAILLFFSLLFFNVKGTKAQVATQDSLALIAFYNSTSGSTYWTYKTNWLTNSPVGTWYGVYIRNGRVTKIVINYNQLYGTLPSEMNNLTELDTLNLSYNSIYGELPDLSSLKKLKQLALGRNSYITGEFPLWISQCTSLVELHLWGNQLSGSIPASIGDLSNLEHLSISNDSLTGSLPKELGKLIKLKTLYLWGNKLEGVIPPELGNLISIDNIELSDNRLTGGIPKEFGKLINLRDLNLTRNMLSGKLPKELENCKKLEELALGGNGELSGEFPSWVTTLTSLKELYLWGNKFTGSIPQTIDKLQNLIVLSIGRNQLTGSIPKEIGNLISLSTLGLYDNQLTGSIPKEFGNLANLNILHLYKNQLSGSIPNELGNLSKCTELFLYENILSGSLPNSITFMKNLEYLHVGDNNLTGEIKSPFFIKLPRLKAFTIYGNSISGTMPDDLAACDSLYYVSVSSNRFEGAIPTTLQYLPLLKYANFDSNSFSSAPDLSNALFVSQYTLNANKLTFGSLEPNAGVTGFYYTPQDSIPLYAEKQGPNVRLWVQGDGFSNVYKWLKNGNVISGNDSAIIISEAENITDYQCEVTNSTLPDLTLYTLPAIITAGIREEEVIFSAIEITPSVTNSKITLTYNLKNADRLTIRIYDASNKLVRNISEEREAQGMHSHKVDCSALASGSYSVRIESSVGSVYRRFLVVK